MCIMQKVKHNWLRFPRRVHGDYDRNNPRQNRMAMRFWLMRPHYIIDDETGRVLDSYPKPYIEYWVHPYFVEGVNEKGEPVKQWNSAPCVGLKQSCPICVAKKEANITKFPLRKQYIVQVIPCDNLDMCYVNGQIAPVFMNLGAKLIPQLEDMLMFNPEIINTGIIDPTGMYRGGKKLKYLNITRTLTGDDSKNVTYNLTVGDSAVLPESVQRVVGNLEDLSEFRDKTPSQTQVNDCLESMGIHYSAPAPNTSPAAPPTKVRNPSPYHVPEATRGKGTEPRF